MSQYTRIVTSGNMPPDVPLKFETDDGDAVPAANEIIFTAVDSSDNNDNGVIFEGSGNTVTLLLTNRATSTVSTSDDTTTTALTFPLGGVAGVYYVEGSIVAFNQTDVAGGVYNFISGMRTTGAAATEIGTEDKAVFEEAAMADSDFAITVSGNDAIVQVTGIVGKTIDWNILLKFRFVS
jgi:hypothetical protein